MKFVLLAVILLLAACSSPPPKIYTKPEIGMPYLLDFTKLCGLSPDSTKVLTTAQGETHTLINNWTDFAGNKRPDGCTGTFTFVNGELTSISR